MRLLNSPSAHALPEKTPEPPSCWITDVWGNHMCMVYMKHVCCRAFHYTNTAVKLSNSPPPVHSHTVSDQNWRWGRSENKTTLFLTFGSLHLGLPGVWWGQLLVQVVLSAKQTESRGNCLPPSHLELHCGWRSEVKNNKGSTINKTTKLEWVQDWNILSFVQRTTALGTDQTRSDSSPPHEQRIWSTGD